MKQYPHSFAVETAANALQFCIVTRSRADVKGESVICCPLLICAHQHISTRLELTRCGLYNDVIDDAITTAVVGNGIACKSPVFPRIAAKTFEYTSAQYTEALQNLFAALEAPEKE